MATGNYRDKYRKEREEQSETTELAVANSSVSIQAPAHIASQFDDFDLDFEASTDDFIVPRLLLMQGSSDLVKEGVANIGEYRDNSGELLAAKDQDLEVIIFKRDKYWSVSEVDDKGKKVKGGAWRREPFEAENPRLPWEFSEDGVSYSRTLVYELFVITLTDNGEDAFGQIPKVFSLSRSAIKTAKDINSKLMKLRTMKKLPVSHCFNLGRRLEKNASGESYLVPTAILGRETTSIEQEAAAFWRNELTRKNVSYDQESGD